MTLLNYYYIYVILQFCNLRNSKFDYNKNPPPPPKNKKKTKTYKKHVLLFSLLYYVSYNCVVTDSVNFI